MKRFFLNYLRNAWAIDLRSLALFRIAMAILLLCDLGIRFTDLEAHYSDAGVLPRDALLGFCWRTPQVSLHMIHGSVEGLTVLFGLNAAAYLCLLIGVRTFLATLVSWFCLISLHTRNPLILQGGDNLLRLLLFWSLFLPLGARWSVDAKQGRKVPEPNPFFSIAGVALLLQPVWMYVFTALFKNGKEWRVDGTAIYYALHIEQFATPFGTWFRQFGEVLRPMTFAVWWFELLGPALFFLPFATVPMRCVALLAFLGMQFGFFLSMELAIFPFASSLALIPFIPTVVWDALISRLPRWEFQFHALRTPGWIARLIPRLSPVPMYAAYAGSVETIWPEGGGRSPEERTARKPSVYRSWILQTLVFALLAYTFVWNAAEVKSIRIKVPSSLDWLADALRIDQLWDMFAPYPSREDGWYVISGHRIDGTEVDVFRGLDVAPSQDPPPVIAHQYTNDRWRSYLMNLWLVEYSEHRPFYARYLCHRWNKTHHGASKLADLTIAYMSREVQPDYLPKTPEYVSLLEQNCEE